MTTPSDLLTRELRRDGARPFITYYDPTTGGRVELSVTTTVNWVAKIAGYLTDELDIYEPIVIDPTLHWVTAVLLLAGWEVGTRVETELAAVGERLEVSLDPMGVGLSTLVAAYPDFHIPTEPSGEDELSAARGKIPEGARVLTVLPLDKHGAVWGLLAPLAAGGSVVYGGADAAASERVTHTVGIDVPGLPRLG